MRIQPCHLVALAISLTFPIGAGCSGGAGDTSGSGGTLDSCVGSCEEDTTVVATVGGGQFIPPGVWLKSYGDAEDQRASAVAFSYAGEIALAGTAKGTINFGNMPWEGTKTDTDVVVAKLSVDGQSLWSRRYGDSCDQHSGAVAHLSSGNVLVAGDFCGTMDFGKTTLQTKGTEVDAFVAVIDTFGEDVYSRSFGGKGAQIVRGAAVDPTWNTVIVGSFDQAFDDGNGEQASAGLDDGFVIKLDPKGALLWSLTFGGPGSDIPRAVAIDTSGNIVIGGSFGGSVDLGGGPLTAPVGHPSGFVIGLDVSGKHLWSKALGGDADSVVNAVAVSPKGTIAATGTFTGAADFGAGPVTSMGGDDAFLAVMDGAGKPTWGRVIAGAETQRGTGVTFAANEDLVFSGTSDEALDLSFQVPINVLALPFTPLAPSMVFAVKLNASGTTIAGWVMDGSDAVESVGIGIDQTSAMVIAGSFQQAMTSQAATAPVQASGGWDIFVARGY
jgi:hypothetical protein